MTIGIIGAGSWGTALAVLLARQSHGVLLLGRDEEQVRQIMRQRENPDYLPGIRLPEQVRASASLTDALEASALILVTPSQAVREMSKNLRAAGLPEETILVCCTKGIEFETGKRMSEILAENCPDNPIAVLSGPSHAEEVARETPTAVVLGCRDQKVARRLQRLFSCGTFRAYTSGDITGIELGGALKNIYAIAAGVCDGLDLGDNAKAALVTRSLAELIRLGSAMGGRAETFQGLSGIGDLIVTCYSRHSRNRSFGERLGRGETAEQIRASMKMIAEGVPTTRSAQAVARRLGIETPILDQVYALLYEGQRAQEAMVELLNRDPKPEHIA